MDDGELILKGHATTREGKPKFRIGVLRFPKASYDEANSVQHFEEGVDIAFDSLGRFRVSVYPGSSGEAWIGQLNLTDYRGKVYREARVLPATGEVDWFTAPFATDEDLVMIPENRYPILTTDYNKPGGPLQLTDQGQIQDSHIPGDFLRVDDDRLPDLFMKNYLTAPDYYNDQKAQRRTYQVQFFNQTEWVFDFSELGIDYVPLVQTFDSDMSELDGALSYPVGTTKVLVEWDAPTSGLLVLR